MAQKGPFSPAASSWRTNEQLSGNTPSQMKNSNGRSSILASEESSEMKEHVPSNTPSATAIQPLHWGSFYPDKAFHLVLRSATIEKAYPQYAVKYWNYHPLAEEHRAVRQQALQVGGTRRRQAGLTAPPASLGRKKQTINWVMEQPKTGNTVMVYYLYIYRNEQHLKVQQPRCISCIILWIIPYQVSGYLPCITNGIQCPQE